MVEPKTTANQGTIPLTTLRRGQQATILTDHLDPADAQSLHAMGLRAQARITLCSPGRTTVVAIGCGCGCSCRIGLDKQLAQKIQVTPLNNN